MRPQQNTGNAAERVRTRPAAFLFLISEKSVNIGNQTDAGGVLSILHDNQAECCLYLGKML